MDFKIRVGRNEVTVRENLVDRAVRYVAPVRAAQRLRARVQMALVGGYTGASRGKRSLSTWAPGATSADAALLPDLPDLRDRSRDLVRNSPVAAGAIAAVVTNVVGTGLALQAQPDAELLGWDEARTAEWVQQVEREYRLWAESKNCDVTRTQNFYGLQDLAFRSTLENGDTFAILPYVKRAGWPYEYCVQLVEADRCSNPKWQMDSATCAGGVQVDQHGAPVGYHILNFHPGERYSKTLEWKRYDAFGSDGQRNVLHLYRRLRIGQTRGVPYLAAVIEPLKQLDRYSEAEVSAAVVSSFFAVFIKSEGRGVSPLESATTGTTPGAGSSDAPAGNWDGKLTPGLVADLGPGESIESANPGRPNAKFEPFFQAVLRQVGVALELPFEVLIKHYTSSYTAARAATLDAWKFFRGRRDWLASDFCQPCYEGWMAEAVALNRIQAPGFFDDAQLRAAYLRAQWVGDAPGSVDPLKEANAAKINLELCRTTLAKETMAHDGSDWKENIKQLGEEKKAKDAAGVVPEPVPAADGAAPSRDDDTDLEDDGKGAPQPGDDQDEPPRRAPGNSMLARLVEIVTAAINRPQPAPQVNFNEGAIQVHPGNTTIAEGAVKVSTSTNVTAPAAGELEKTVTYGDDGRIEKITERRPG